MGLWEFCTIAVIFGIGLEVIRLAFRHREKLAEASGRQYAFSDRLVQIEQRLNNLETIIIERDKHKAFDAAL